ncbi:hypothetical protein MSG28_010871 [Choristoneura fumiferana]|uniref:Uncharacterized protein n=1 Tax=Choristoneura fumiferana TaxID=7141 RepID=A0ACC0KPB4_CHOFU|nr:hypothetical protein MSG28_010871 [Choristoneura fumiferana]
MILNEFWKGRLKAVAECLQLLDPHGYHDSCTPASLTAASEIYLFINEMDKCGRCVHRRGPGLSGYDSIQIQ